MTCTKCGDKPKKNCGAFPKAVIEIDNPERIVLLRKVLVPASMGDESTFPPTIGKYHNVLLEYEASGGIYLYSSDGIPTKLSSDVTELQAQLNALRVRIGEEEVARADADTALSGRITSLDNSLATVARTGSYSDLSNKPTIGNGTLTIKKNGSNVGTFTANATTNKNIDISVPTKTSDLANDGSDGTSTYVEADELSTVATTGSYNDLTNKPTIPTVNNATLTIQKNGTNVQTFTANSSTNKTANITVPTAVSELTNDASYATTTQLNNGLATKQDTLTAGNNIQINGNTISATDTTYTAGNAIDITNGEISADIHPADFFTAEDTVSDCGSDLNLDNTMASTLRSVELRGDTFQQSYSGKNLLLPSPKSSASSGLTASYDATTGVVTLSGTASNNWSNAFNDVAVNLSAGTYTFSATTEAGLGRNITFFNGSTNILQKSLSATATSVECVVPQATTSLRLWLSPTNGTNYTGKTFKIQLETGSQATSFEPYVGGMPSPNPDYPQNIQVVTGEQTVTVSGKNAIVGLSIAGTTYVSYDIDTNLLSSAMVYSFTPNFSATGATIYVRSRSSTTYVYSVANADIVANQKNTITFTLTDEQITNLKAQPSIIQIYKANAGWEAPELSEPMLEPGSTATTYEPYQSATYTVNLGSIELCKIGDYQDYIYKEDDDWYVHKEIEAFDLSTGTYVATTSSIRGLTDAPNIKYVPNNQTIGSAITSGYRIRQGQGLGTAGAGWFAVDTNRVNFNTGGSTDPVGMLYYARETAANILIENPDLVAELNALAEAKSYNDQTNIVVTAAGENLPATLCVEAYRKSLEGVIEAIDNACTCRKNLVVHLPNGMTTYENNDAPIPIPEVLEAFKRGQSVFLVDDAPGHSDSVYTVTAVDMDDGIYSMRVDQTGINPRISDGHWHIGGGGDVWDSVTFINDATPDKYSPNIYNKTWFRFTSSSPLLDGNRRTYYPASRDVTFNNTQGNLSVAELWEKLASSAWNGNPVVLEVPLQDISTQTTSLVDNGFTAENPLLTITVSLGPDSYFERETSEYIISGWAAECTPITFGGKEAYAAGIVRVVEDGNTTYSFVVSLTEVANPIN